MLKEIKFSKHALKRADDRGVSLDEASEVILTSKWNDTDHQRHVASKIFEYNKTWGNKIYRQKDVIVVFKEEDDKITVITVIARYFL